MVVDKIADKLGLSFTNKVRNTAHVINTKINGKSVILVKPITFMNLSGQSVAGFVRKLKIAPENVIVVCDDIDLPKGTTRYREKGSGGTHNGLRSIVQHIGPTFKRVKIGCANDTKLQLKDYVLSVIDAESQELINPALDEAIEKVLKLIV
jgi:PTH1 family peptidyl-tRNA hydrolase